MDSLDGWTSLKFNKIPENKVLVENNALKIQVDKSSSPLVYKFKKPMKINGFKVKARWSGAINIPQGKVQGDKGVDDFVLKFGLVESGTETLNWMQKKLAADWILELYKLAPSGTGVKQINFYSTTLQKDQLNKKRTHPLSELLYEERVVWLKESGKFEMSQKFEQPTESLGLWLSSDGDDTGSQLELVIESIELQ